MYAVVSSGGKQYRVEPGSTLTVERLAVERGAPITFDRVLLVADGDAITVGTPTVSGATVSGTVIGETLGPKLVIFKFKQKVKYRRRAGHRQHLTTVRIDEISANGRTASASEAAPAESGAKADTDKAAAKPAARRRTSAAKKDEAKKDEAKE